METKRFATMQSFLGLCFIVLLAFASLANAQNLMSAPAQDQPQKPQDQPVKHISDMPEGDQGQPAATQTLPNSDFQPCDGDIQMPKPDSSVPKDVLDRLASDYCQIVGTADEPIVKAEIAHAKNFDEAMKIVTEVAEKQRGSLYQGPPVSGQAVESETRLDVPDWANQRKIYDDDWRTSPVSRNGYMDKKDLMSQVKNTPAFKDALERSTAIDKCYREQIYSNLYNGYFVVEPISKYALNGVVYIKYNYGRAMVPPGQEESYYVGKKRPADEPRKDASAKPLGLEKPPMVAVVHVNACKSVSGKELPQKDFFVFNGCTNILELYQTQDWKFYAKRTEKLEQPKQAPPVITTAPPVAIPGRNLMSGGPMLPIPVPVQGPPSCTGYDPVTPDRMLWKVEKDQTVPIPTFRALNTNYPFVDYDAVLIEYKRRAQDPNLMEGDQPTGKTWPIKMDFSATQATPSFQRLKDSGAKLDSHKIYLLQAKFYYDRERKIECREAVRLIFEHHCSVVKCTVIPVILGFGLGWGLCAAEILPFCGGGPGAQKTVFNPPTPGQRNDLRSPQLDKQLDGAPPGFRKIFGLGDFPAFLS